MKSLAINGSPRKQWNTATLLKTALAGAESAGAETELVNLYDLNFQGCTSCFSCKLKDGKSYGKCVMKDELTPVLEKLLYVDVLILGSPIYFGTVSGEIKSFMERLLFPYLIYTNPPGSLFARRISTAFIYTMNMPEYLIKERHYDIHIGQNENLLTMIFGRAESLWSCETLQFEDYDKVVFSYADPKERRERHKTIFPEDCRRAFELGARLTKDFAAGMNNNQGEG
ncbi:MAG: flavodoxin family protein [Smithella sp.]